LFISSQNSSLVAGVVLDDVRLDANFVMPLNSVPLDLIYLSGWLWWCNKNGIVVGVLALLL